jgi:hypothetical protein
MVHHLPRRERAPVFRVDFFAARFARFFVFFRAAIDFGRA